MEFLDAPTRYMFFTGKGGVGKTSIACASALYLADQGRRVLLVSTDPASNLDDVFELRVSSKPTGVPGVTGLDIVNVDPEASASAYKERVVGPFRGILPADAVRHMEEQLSGSCTVEIAAFDEFTGLLTDDRIASAYDHVIFDTAPTGHTLRLMALPLAWTTFLDSNTNGASCLGPLSGLSAQKGRYEAAVAALSDTLQTTIVMVARPERSALREADRSAHELELIGLRNQKLVVNGVFTPSFPGDSVADSMAERQHDAMIDMPLGIASLPRTTIPLKRTKLIGLASLRDFIRDEPVEAARPPMDQSPIVIDGVPPLADLIDEIESSGHGVILTMGKGGVGKTTVAAAIAVELARRGHSVHLTTTDPAAHVLETITSIYSNLVVDRIDPKAETKAYRDGVVAKSADSLDAAALSLLEEDLRSPCTEEVAVFRAFSRVINEARHRFVVIDTAPTGHTLLLMDATGSYHREVMRQLGRGRGQNAIASGDDGYVVQGVTTPMMRLQDPSHTKVIIVTLAETTPVLEASRLQDDLRRAKIEPYAWVINGSLAATSTTDPVLHARALNECALIEAVRDQHASRTYLVPWQTNPPIGSEALRTFIGERTST